MGVPFPFTYGQIHHNIMSQKQWMAWCDNIMAFRTVTEQVDGKYLFPIFDSVSEISLFLSTDILFFPDVEINTTSSSPFSCF